MKKIQSQSTSNPASISQAAAVAALDGDQGCIAPMVKAFKERHDFVVYQLLNDMPGIRVPAHDGTFYTFPTSARPSAIGRPDNDVDLAAFLLKEAGVALVPGSAFGLPGHMRLSFATSMANLEDALGRIRKALAALIRPARALSG
jgi:aspartate aminotransferase